MNDRSVSFRVDRRIRRVSRRILSLDFAPLCFGLWLRWRGLEFRNASCVAPEDGNIHSHSGGPRLASILGELRVPAGSVVLDLGVGMGIAAITLSRHFKTVIGVELSADLLEIAKRNVAKLRITNIELHCADARSFDEDLDRVTHVYMFNPFPAPVMSAVFANLKRSLARAPRPLTIIYCFPVCHDEVVRSGFVHLRTMNRRNTHPYAIYSSPPPPRGERSDSATINGV